MRAETTTHYRLLFTNLSDSPGVYLFYGKQGELLYIGKSKTVRSRVQSHFAAREEQWMCRQVSRVDVRRTAGELGALLLESELIKELKPMYNIRLRQTRRVIVARKVVTRAGYHSIVIEHVSMIDPKAASPIMAIFKSRTQSKEYLASIAHTYRLCPKLLGLESTSRCCFSYHLHQCNGACIGLEQPPLYNARFEEAFSDRRVKAWPFEGGVVIHESSGDGSGDVFLVDHWCLVYSFSYSDKQFKLEVNGPRRFDYDSYKILATYIFDESNRSVVQEVSRGEFEAIVQTLNAA